MNQIEKEIKIVGISTVTSTEAAFNQDTIGKLWGEFLQAPIKEKLTEITSSSIFAVYTDYESGYQGKYKITIGYAVNDVSNVPDGLTITTIPAGKYKTFPAKSSAPEDVVSAWKMIWQIDEKIFKPNFVATLEEYKDNGEIIIYVGHD